MPQVSELAKVPADNEVIGSRLMIARGRYQFSVDGGAVSQIALTTGTPIPSGALILGCFLDVTTAPTSAGAATISVDSEAAADLNAADAISGAPWTGTGWKAMDKTWATAPIETTAARNISITIGTAALTAGDFTVIVFYLPPGL